MILKKDEFIQFFKIVLGKIASAARNLIDSSPQTEATTFAFSSVFILLLWVGYSTCPCLDILFVRRPKLNTFPAIAIAGFLIVNYRIST